MDAFEHVVCGLLSQKGYWVTQGFKVELTKEEKVAIRRASSPRWEIDIVAYSGGRKELLAVECKSYLDSGGVDSASLVEVENPKSRYKLFTDEVLRKVVLNRLNIQMADLSLIPSNVIPKLALAVGKFKNESSKKEVQSLFADRGWHLFDPDWIREELHVASRTSYFDSVSHVVSKLLTRNPKRE